MPTSRCKDLRRTFFLTPMAEIHQYATNSNQAMVSMERTGIFGFPYNQGGDPLRLTQATGAKFRRGIVERRIGQSKDWLLKASANPTDLLDSYR